MDIDQVLAVRAGFRVVGTEDIPIIESLGRILAKDVVSDIDIPAFARSTMDGYAVRASSTFGSSEGNPAYVMLKGTIRMGDRPGMTIGPGEAARISTGGMMPQGADGVVMIEHTEPLDETAIEIYKSIAPGQHVIEAGEDFKENAVVLPRGSKIRSQELGLLAAVGRETVPVYKKPVAGIISTGDEVVPVHQKPGPGQIRDINSYTLAGLVQAWGGESRNFGIMADEADILKNACDRALEVSDMVLISGGSSVGTRDCTLEVLSALPDAEILAHGISISPGKPTILAKTRGKSVWGLPGHAVSAMIVFFTIVRPFLAHISGLNSDGLRSRQIPARLSRNLASAQGRVDFIRVRLIEKEDGLWAEPILGKSGLIRTMVMADGIIEIGRDVEGLYQGEIVRVIPL